jgi:hypothetical protein
MPVRKAVAETHILYGGTDIRLPRKCTGNGAFVPLDASTNQHS